MTSFQKASISSEVDDEKIGAVQIRVVALCALLLAFDGYDIVAVGFAIPSLIKAWGIPPGAFTPAIVLGGVGMLLGSFVSGFYGDRFGRRPVFIACVAIFGLFSMLSAFCDNMVELAAARFLTGLGLGGGIPTAIALASDYSPRPWQGTLVSAMSAGVPAGVLCGGLIAGALIPNYGWKSVFIFGGVVPLILVPVLLVWLPESIPFLRLRERASSGGDVTSRSNPVARLFQNGLTPVTLLLWTMFAMNVLATYLVVLWLPVILNAAGSTPSQAVFGTTLLPLAGIIGAFCLGFPIDKYGAERTLTISLLVGAIAAFAAGFMEPSYHALLILIFGIGLGVSGSQLGMNALSGSAYATEIRSTGSGWALGLGRLGNILGPLLGGILLNLGYPAKTIFLFAAGPIVVAAVAMALLGVVRSRTASNAKLSAGQVRGHA